MWAPIVLVVRKWKIPLGTQPESVFVRQYAATPPVFATFFGQNLVFEAIPSLLVTLADSEAKVWMVFPMMTATSAASTRWYVWILGMDFSFGLPDAQPGSDTVDSASTAPCSILVLSMSSQAVGTQQSWQRFRYCLEGR